MPVDKPRNRYPVTRCHDVVPYGSQFSAKYKVLDNGCWEWIASKTPSHGGVEYGQCRYEGKKHRAHRVAYMRAYGPIPVSHDVHHTCNFSLCVNHAHLEAVPSTSHRVANFGRDLTLIT